MTCTIERKMPKTGLTELMPNPASSECPVVTYEPIYSIGGRLVFKGVVAGAGTELAVARTLDNKPITKVKP